MKEKNIIRQLLPVMVVFFVMGFVDLVGIAINYAKVDFELSDTLANLFPSMVFFWFLIFSVPTGMLMNRIGRRKTVLISLAVTIASLLRMPDKKDEVSGLMVMGLFGGTIFPLLMGVCSDMIGNQSVALLIMTIGVLYLLTFYPRLKK